MKKVQQLHKSGGDVTAFLQTAVDFDFVSPALSSIGLKRGEILNLLTSESYSEASITNEVVVDLDNFRSRENLPAVMTPRWLKKLTGDETSEQTVGSTVKKLMNTYRTLLKQKGGAHDDKMKQFLQSSFFSRPQQASMPLNVTETINKENQKKSMQQDKIKHLSEDIATLKVAAGELASDRLLLIQEVKDLRKKVVEQKQALRELQPLNVRKLKNKIVELKCNSRKAKRLRKQLETERVLFKRRLASEQRNTRKWKAKGKQKDTLINRLQQQLANLEISESPKVIQTRIPEQCNRFNDDVRKTIIALITESNLPSTKCQTVIRVVAKYLFHQDLPDLPSTVVGKLP